MRKCGLLAVMVAATAALAGAETFRVSMAGSNEPNNAGDPDGAGVAFVSIEETTVGYYLWVKSIDAPTAAHIHTGRAGVNGGVVQSFSPTFNPAGPGVFVASGVIAGVSAGTVSSILADPAGFYVNVHNPTYPGGAVRGQLLGGGPAPNALANHLRGGDREKPNPGDPDGSGFGGVVLDGGDVYFFLSVDDIAAPTAAHIHRGTSAQSGSVLVGFGPVFTDGFAFGMVSPGATVVDEILANPNGFYVNVHNADFPGGAVRGQLAATETVQHFPVVARNPGAGASSFVSDARLLTLADTDVTVWAEWYPKNTAGLTGPAAIAPITIPARGEAVVNDIAGSLFGATDRGAVRLVGLSPFLAVGRTFNDRRATGGGTYGQLLPAHPLSDAAPSGVLLLGSDRPRVDRLDFRTNLGYFNPNPFPVDITFTVGKPDGSLVGTSTTVTIPGLANDLQLYHQIVTGVPEDERTQADFFIAYSAPAPVFIYSSVVDNKTDDGLHQPARPRGADLDPPRSRPPAPGFPGPPPPLPRPGGRRPGAGLR